MGKAPSEKGQRRGGLLKKEKSDQREGSRLPYSEREGSGERTRCRRGILKKGKASKGQEGVGAIALEMGQHLVGFVARRGGKRGQFGGWELTRERRYVIFRGERTNRQKSKKGKT